MLDFHKCLSKLLSETFSHLRYSAVNFTTLLKLKGTLKVEHALVEVFIVISNSRGVSFLEPIYVFFLIFNHELLKRDRYDFDSRELRSSEKQSRNHNNIIDVHFMIMLDELLLDTRF